MIGSSLNTQKNLNFQTCKNPRKVRHIIGFMPTRKNAQSAKRLLRRMVGATMWFAEIRPVAMSFVGFVWPIGLITAPLFTTVTVIKMLMVPLRNRNRFFRVGHTFHSIKYSGKLTRCPRKIPLLFQPLPQPLPIAKEGEQASNQCKKKNGQFDGARYELGGGAVPSTGCRNTSKKSPNFNVHLRFRFLSSTIQSNWYLRAESGKAKLASSKSYFQANLEHATEQLSEYLERELPDTEKGVSEVKCLGWSLPKVIVVYWFSVQDRVRYCKDRSTKLIEHVHEGTYGINSAGNI